MIILHISSGDFFSTYGGGQVYVKNIAEEMAKGNDIINIISFVPEKPEYTRSVLDGIHIYEVPESTGDIDYIVRKISPDIIHAHGHKALACECGKHLGIPVVVTAHHGGIVCPGGALMDVDDSICKKTVCHKNCLPCILRNIRTGEHWYPLMKQLPESTYQKIGGFLKGKPFLPFITPIGQAALSIKEKQKEWNTITTNCSKMIAPCHAIADAMIRNGLLASKVAIIPHGIPLPNVTYEQTQVHHDKIVRFFYVGRICYIKGIHILLKAFGQIKEKSIELHLIGGAGNKAEKHYMRNLQQLYRYDNRVFWHGKISHNEMSQVICKYDIAIAPTICVEIFGLNIAEALSIGKPVLATRCGGAEMQIIDGENGWLVEPNNVEALVNKLIQAEKEYRLLNKQKISNKVKSIGSHCEELRKLYISLIR